MIGGAGLPGGQLRVAHSSAGSAEMHLEAALALAVVVVTPVLGVLVVVCHVFEMTITACQALLRA